MKILKASAGSGKTYRLAKTYLSLLTSSSREDAYRHILAVTFTNKATSEMKARILSELYSLSKTSRQAEKLLHSLLHDYSAFSVSTIDRFFQQVLKSFSREIGQMADYQIELDRGSVIKEAMDRILESLTSDDRQLLDWIRAGVQNSLQSGTRLRIEDNLYESGVMLKSEEQRLLFEQQSLDETESFSRPRLEAIRAECTAIIESFTRKVLACGMDCSTGSRFTTDGKVRSIKKNPAMLELLDSQDFVLYNTAWILRERMFSLGLAGEFYRSFDAILKEKNIMCLDESNRILKDIIHGSDAPFIYEKTGTRYDHFLLDEFQDTSTIQWENFLPLLRESESRGGKNLIVGDVKQSIYRWRNSDWRLLAQGVQRDIDGCEVEVLTDNWRSCAQVVEFNNSFFFFASRALGLEELYCDVSQNVQKKNDLRGSVSVTFLEDQEAVVLSSIRRALERGARYSDIAILVRGRKEGGKIASTLISEGFRVISEDSLSLKSSPVVQTLVCLMGAYDNPEDPICAFLSAEYEVSFPQSYRSILDFCESLLRSLTESGKLSLEGQELYIDAFLDDIRSYTELYGNKMGDYLKHYEESDLLIGSPEGEDAIRIMTIHKSKGLEFPYVIFPYADQVSLYKPSAHWCTLGEEYGTLAGCYPVNLSSGCLKSGFEEAYLQEYRSQVVDNLNVLYVALTRAVKGLHIIARPVSKTFADKLSKGKGVDYTNMSELIYQYCGFSPTDAPEKTFGTMYDFSTLERKEDNASEQFSLGFESISTQDRLVSSSEAREFFGDDGSVGVQSSARLRGIVLHSILSSVLLPSDLEASLSSALENGLIDPSSAEKYHNLLKDRIEAHPEWFPEDVHQCRVLNEQDIFDSDGSTHRPDRVVIRDGKARIVDFKFGEPSEKYLRQLRKYATLYTRAGFEVEQASVWYVENDIVVNVEL